MEQRFKRMYLLDFQRRFPDTQGHRAIMMQRIAEGKGKFYGNVWGYIPPQRHHTIGHGKAHGLDKYGI